MTGTLAAGTTRHLLNAQGAGGSTFIRLKPIYEEMLEALPAPEDTDQMLLVDGKAEALWVAHGQIFAIASTAEASGDRNADPRLQVRSAGMQGEDWTITVAFELGQTNRGSGIRSTWAFNRGESPFLEIHGEWPIDYFEAASKEEVFARHLANRLGWAG